MSTTDPIDSLLVDVRANTQAFAQDVAQMRASFDGTLVEGLGRAGPVLEKGLLGALKKAGQGFVDLRRVALDALEQIGAEALQALAGGKPNATASGGGNGPASALAGFGQALAGALGLPGRATGGPVSPGRAYVVGESGAEVFVPTSAGRIEPAGSAAGPRDVRVAITVQAPAGAAPRALQLSSRQVAAAVRRALRDT